MHVDIKSHNIDVPDGTSITKVSSSSNSVKKESTECFCKKDENQFYWSDQLTCDQRKKVLQVCSELWGESKKKEKASELMSIMHLETAKTFSPSIDNGKGYSGLIQFSDAAAKSIGTTRRDLKKMSFTEQMDYVKKYLEKKKTQLNTMTDLYLMVLKPNAVGQGNNPDFVLFDENIAVPNVPFNKDNLNKEPWVTKYGYTSNPPFMVEKDERVLRMHNTYSKGKIMRYGFVGGKTSVWEVTEVITKEHYNIGKPHIFKGNCENIKEEKKDNKDRTPWMETAIEEAKSYGGKKESTINDRITTYHKDGGGLDAGHSTAWCASFVCWCIENKGYKSAHSAGSRIFLTSSNVEKCEVFYGAVAIFSDCDSTGKKMKSSGHATFVFGKISGDNYACLGGNQADMLKISKYDCSGNVFVSWKDKKGNKHYKIFRGFYKPKDFIINDVDKLSDDDNYTSADKASEKVLNLKIKSNESGESSR